MKEKILVIGALGQIGTELTAALRAQYGEEYVVASDIREKSEEFGLYEYLDVMDKKELYRIAKKHKITQVYNLAAMLSATAEKYPNKGWDLNMVGLLNGLDLAKDGHVQKIFWPSSIAVFGPNTPREDTPQHTIMDPTTVYGISKLAGERWCAYYAEKYNVDVRSVRYPGLLGYKSLPGGGTTDYAVAIFHEALLNASYSCYLSETTALPMMYMADAVKATIGIMDAPKEAIKIRSSYNISGVSFTPQEIAACIREHIPNFKISYSPDYRQKIADSWPKSIEDSAAKNDWNWLTTYDMPTIVADMLKNLQKSVTL